jgi:mannose-6-phosphate isomerase-like protein (cupin superfamily)
MARFLIPDEPAAREILAAAGVDISAARDGDVPSGLLAEALPAQHQAVKQTVTAHPSDDARDSGMGAWHVNAVDEVHVVTSGEGVFQFATDQGTVSVAVVEGDVLWIRGAEHRYRPLTSQGWLLRFAGDDLGARETGRPAGEWPDA